MVGRAYQGIPVRMDDITLRMERRGYQEETHFSFSYTPVRNQMVETGEPWATEFTYAHDAINVHLRLTAAKVGDGFAVTFADLTDRRRAEHARHDWAAASADTRSSTLDVLAETFGVHPPTTSAGIFV